MRDRLVPRPADVLDRAPHADGINRGRRRERTRRHRHVEAPPVGTHHVGEQEGAALLFVEAALELPAHQRVKLGVLVDLAVDTDEQPGGIEPCEVLLEIGRRPAALWRLVGTLIGTIEHSENLLGGGSLAIQADGVSGNK